MTFVVGWSPFHRDAGAVELACRLARSVGETLHVVSVLPAGWGGLARKDGQDAQREGERAATEARSYLDAAGIEGDVVCTAARSVPQALLEAVGQTRASMLVLGSGTDAGIGRIGLSSKSNRLLHSSPVPVALAPRGHRADDPQIDRVTCAFRDEESSHAALEAAAEVAERVGVPLRAVTFGVEPRRMVPSEVSGDAAMVLDEWQRQARAALDRAIADVANDQVSSDVVAGRTWDDALHGVPWGTGDILVVGSSSTMPLAQVFLGSSASKIVRASPVPVVVMP